MSSLCGVTLTRKAYAALVPHLSPKSCRILFASSGGLTQTNQKPVGLNGTVAAAE